MQRAKKSFGGCTILFCEDFRQLIREIDQVIALKEFFENFMSVIITLDNGHQFKGDLKFGELLKSFWHDNLTHKDRITINKWVVTRTDVELPKNIHHAIDWCCVCPTNKERNVISAGVFKQHVLNTHPSVDSDKLPPNHTIVIKGDFWTIYKIKSSSLKVTNTLNH